MQQPLLDPESAYEALPGREPSDGGEEQHRSPANGWTSPDLLESGEVEWGAISNLDLFFGRVYRYYEEKGFWVIVTARVLNLLALGFTAAFSGFLLLWVDWGALRSQCLLDDTCDILDVAILKHPLQHGAPLWSAARILYLLLLGAYWLWNLIHLAVDLKHLAEVRHFCNHRLGLSERAMQTVTWPEVARRIVEVQRHLRLCIKRDLTEHDIVSRIMRKDNYLIGMLNKGVLALNVPLLGQRRFMLTKTLEWNLRWGVLDHMFDDGSFAIRHDFVSHPELLAQRFRRMAIANLALAPFLIVFLAIYFFLRNAEQLYHHPSSVGARRWSPVAKWRLREFNELPHYIDHRLSASHAAAEKYISQFPSPLVAHVARFVAFIAGSFAALALGAALVDDTLLERHLAGRTLVWWAATLGVILAISRAFIVDSTNSAFHPELAMLEVVAHTHYLPRHWRGRAQTREVQTAFQSLFQFKAVLLAEEMLSILLTPFVLYYSLPQCAGAIAAFVREATVHVDGVGDMCSMACFDFQRHGNSRYGSPVHCPKGARSRQGKMEKSLLSFATTYPGWDPGAAAKQMLATLQPQLQEGAEAASQPWSGLQATHMTGPHFPFTAHLGDMSSRPGSILPRGPPSAWRPLQPSTSSAAWPRQRSGNAARRRRSIFASAELPPPVDGSAEDRAGGRDARVSPNHDANGLGSAVGPGAAAAASFPLPSAGADGGGGGSWIAAAAAASTSNLNAADRVAASQMLLQSFYEEHDEEELPADQPLDEQQHSDATHHTDAAAAAAVSGRPPALPPLRPPPAAPNAHDGSGLSHSGSGGNIGRGPHSCRDPAAGSGSGGQTSFGGDSYAGWGMQQQSSGQLSEPHPAQWSAAPDAQQRHSYGEEEGGAREMMPPAFGEDGGNGFGAADPLMTSYSHSHEEPQLQPWQQPPPPQLQQDVAVSSSTSGGHGSGSSAGARPPEGWPPRPATSPRAVAAADANLGSSSGFDYVSQPADRPPPRRTWAASPRAAVAAGRSGGSRGPPSRQISAEMAYLGTSPGNSSGAGFLP